MEAPSGVKLKEGTYTFQLTQKITPRVPTEAPYQKKKVLAGQILSRDPETGRARTARFIPGIKSFWLDEQDKVDPKYARANIWSPEFINGTLVLEHPRDEELIRYMLTRDDFEGKENRVSKEPPVYTLVDEQQEAEVDVDFLLAKHKAEGIALTAKLADMKQHATFLNIALTSGKNERSEEAIRKDYVKFASSNPAAFMKSIDSPVARVTAQIKTAIKNGQIDMAHMKNQAHWAESKGFIMALDPSKTALNNLVEFALSEKGKDFVKRLDALNK